jgi:GR25 family glycosyltransferase involved in LPS biosynthesis
MITVNDYFDKVFLFSLKRRTDRRAQAIKKLQAVGIKFTVIDAVDAHNSPALKAEHQAYLEYPIIDARSAFYDKKYKIKSLEHIGALGLLKTWEVVLKNALHKQLKNILIFEDDVILSTNFQKQFETFIEAIGSQKWQALLLGATQRYWSQPEYLSMVENKPYYLPKRTHGTLAIAINQAVFEELLGQVQNFNSPIDAEPLHFIYEKYFEQCFVAYPHLCIQDVSSSDIHKPRNQRFYAHSFKWDLNEYDI